MKRLIPAFLLLPLLSGCYLTKQGLGQAQLLLSRQPIDKVVAEPTATAEQKAKFALIREAKAYAEDVIGLRKSHNYQDYVKLDRDALSYVVSAAPKDALTAHTWWFPIIGAVPYKGFFDRADAVAEKASLDAAGYDTILRNVPAFSTLGWLPDPVYSPFLAYENHALANTVIHELTHVTLYLAGQAGFNENFATFVGNVGAQGFLERKFGEGSPEYAAAKAGVADNRLFTEFVQELSAKLDALYASDRPREAKLMAREQVFAEAKARFEQAYLPRMQGRQFRNFTKGTLNNAALISYRTYYNRLDRFERAHTQLGGDLRRTVAFFRDTIAKKKDPEAALELFLGAPTPDKL